MGKVGIIKITVKGDLFLFKISVDILTNISYNANIESEVLKLKTFPIILTDKEHKEIKQEALNRDQSIKDFISTAIMNSLANKPMKEGK